MFTVLLILFYHLLAYRVRNVVMLSVNSEEDTDIFLW